jgi:hypothetical protein
MNPHHDDDDERRLAALFDETAPEASPDALARMARKAALVPAARRPWYRRVFARPLFAGAAVALAAAAALVLYLRAPHDTPRDPIASAVVPGGEDGDDDALFAFELGDDDGARAGVPPLDADPFARDEPDHPIAALELLFSEDESEMELLDAALAELDPEGG